MGPTITIERLVDDGIELTALLRDSLKQDRIVLVGHSWGSILGHPDGRGYAVQRKWSNLFEGADFFLSSTLGFALAAPGYSLADVNDWIDGQILSGERLVPRTSTLDAQRLGGEFSVPIFVIQGAEDFTTPTSLSSSFVDSIRAPRKAFVKIEGGHFAVFMRPDAFLEELVSRVLPLLERP